MKEEQRETIMQSITRLKATTLPADGKLLLFGSQARGDIHEESDWDLLMLLNKDSISPEDFDSFAYPFVLLGLKHGEYFSVKQYSFKEWNLRKGTPFYNNVMREGIEL